MHAVKPSREACALTGIVSSSVHAPYSLGLSSLSPFDTAAQAMLLTCREMGSARAHTFHAGMLRERSRKLYLQAALSTPPWLA